jgi:polysaccharide deacetylase family protein (PEP-CTERM system associated)
MRSATALQLAQGRAGNSRVLNALTVDVEDYFQVSAFDDHVDRRHWASYESRVARNTERLLDIFAEFNVRATCFVLGWVAEHYPNVVRTIAQRGHEIASHGYGHRLIYSQTPEAFRDDLRRASQAIERAGGGRVMGYRAPSFSITERSMWALDVLIEEGYEYDASIFPVRHDRYGIPGSPRHMHRIERDAGSLWEIPGSTLRVGGVNLPAAGGGYFRLLPYKWTSLAIARLNKSERQPAVFYLHPWEIDAAQPRLESSRVSRLRHYTNLHKTESRLRRLLSEFRFGPIRDLLASTKTDAQSSTPARPARSVVGFRRDDCPPRG